MTGSAINLTWAPPGPISAAFMNTPPIQGGLQLVNGPIGGGKTTSMYTKAIRLSARQMPSTITRARNSKGVMVPVRKVKITSVRDTYRQLWKTTLPTWWLRVPKDVGDWNGAENAPASHHVTFELQDGTLVDMIHDFIAIGENAVEDVMRGYQPTFWVLNEFDLLSWDVFTYASGRAGRYPEMSEGGPSWYGILADCNAPEFESDTYQKIFTKSPAELEAIGIHLFRQPSGLSPEAENTKNLVPGYYENAARGKDAYYVARMIENKPGYSRSGKPVHPEFGHTRHVAAQPLEPIPGLALVIGIDPRTNPSAVFLQRLANGQRRVIGELQAEQNTGPRRFGKMLAQYLHDHFPMIRPQQVSGMCDPSAQYGADREAGEHDWLQIVAAVTGVRMRPAPSNNLDVRREALKKPLGESVEDGKPAILISPNCTILIAGLASGFRYRKLNLSGAEKFSEEVEKNHYADICEAAEYACLSDGAQLEIRERKQHDADQLRALSTTAQHDWDPFNHT